MKLNNAFDYSYSGPVYIGSKGQYLEVVYDTGSDWLCIESSECEAGKGPKFESKESTSFKRVGSKDSLREYGSATLKGQEVTDIACIAPFNDEDLAKGTPSFCKKDF